jgi:hypothetical protein
MALDDKERSLAASLPTPSKEEDTTVETLGKMMARLKTVEEVQAENKALMQELKEIREERKSEGVLEKSLVFLDDPFAHIEPAHKQTPRKVKHGYGTRTLSTSEKASPAEPMPEGADGSSYYRDGTCGTGGDGAFLRVSRRLPAGSTVCRAGAGGCAGLRVPGSLHAGRVRERQQSRRTAGTYDGTGQSAGSPDLRRRPTGRPVRSAAPGTADYLIPGIRPAPSDTQYFRPVFVPEVLNMQLQYIIITIYM